MKNIHSWENFLSEGVLDIWKAASSNVGLEDPPGSNKGSLVQKMQSNVGISAGDPWCMAFVYTVFKEANMPKDVMDLIPKTGGVKKSWDTILKNKKVVTFTAEEIKKDPSKLKGGMVFFYLTKDPEKGTYPGSGHTGIIVSADAQKGTWKGFEGNTNPLDGSREGFGTFYVERSIDDPSISKDPKNKPAKFLGVADFLNSHRTGEIKKGFEEWKSLKNSAVQAFNSFTQKEIEKIKKDPNIQKKYEENYKNRNKR
jgi:hypothetical protein